MPEEQIDWLDSQLCSHTDQVNLVFIHHGLIHWSRADREDESKSFFYLPRNIPFSP